MKVIETLKKWIDHKHRVLFFQFRPDEYGNIFIGGKTREDYRGLDTRARGGTLTLSKMQKAMKELRKDAQ